MRLIYMALMLFVFSSTLIQLLEAIGTLPKA